MGLNNESPAVRLCMRNHVPTDIHNRQTVVHDQLRELQTKGRIKDLSAEMWVKKLYVDADDSPIAAEEQTRRPLSMYKEFSEWAEQAGYSLEPAFSTQTVDSLITDTRGKVLRLPIVCLAAYDDDGNVIDVAPRSSEREDVYTVEDFLEKLRRAEKPSATHTPIEKRREHANR